VLSVKKFLLVENINRNIAMNMGATKTTEFTARDNRLAKYAKAMAHPARVAILKFLANKKTCQCGDIVEEMPLSQSTVSQHLKELKAAGLIKGAIEGTRVCYCIDEKEWKAAQLWINQLFDSFNGCGDNCC
jgi:DNA-binding transcriptional ArsR family regulator